MLRSRDALTAVCTMMNPALPNIHPHGRFSPPTALATARIIVATVSATFPKTRSAQVVLPSIRSVSPRKRRRRLAMTLPRAATLASDAPSRVNALRYVSISTSILGSLNSSSATSSAARSMTVIRRSESSTAPARRSCSNSLKKLITSAGSVEIPLDSSCISDKRRSTTPQRVRSTPRSIPAIARRRFRKFHSSRCTGPLGSKASSSYSASRSAPFRPVGLPR